MRPVAVALVLALALPLPSMAGEVKVQPGETLSEIAERRSRRWTLWTSNLDLAAMDSLDARIASRLIRDRNEVIQFRDAPDFALWKK